MVFRDLREWLALVESGPVQENVDIEEQVGLLKFPVPHQHELDGGRYIGTAHAKDQR